MSNTARKGNEAELKSAGLFEDEGGLVSSRRHIGGAGDLVVNWPGEGFLSTPPIRPPWLVEVKARERVWDGFRPQDRIELLAAADRYGMHAYVAWWKPGARRHVLIAPDDWPGA